jgi:hypothetical protein
MLEFHYLIGFLWKPTFGFIDFSLFIVFLYYW